MHEIQRIPIDDWVDNLRSIPTEQFARENVLQHMSGLLLDAESLEPYCHFLPDRYTRNKVFRNELFEVILLCWGVGHSTPVHNHDNQHGWMTVQRGMVWRKCHLSVQCPDSDRDTSDKRT